ncbi:MAG: type II secretion system protein GspG [Planctomycetota bacterium]|nr:type II secretion system protein GspG [Planctomycetota bacterium]
MDNVQNRSNGLGLAGFIVSLIGLCAGGLLSPIGLIMSLFAIGREPRGFAIAGVVIGFIGTCGGAIAALFFSVAIAVALAAAGFTAAAGAIGSMGGPAFQSQIEMAVLAANLEAYRTQHNAYPATLAEGTTRLDANSSLRLDAWDKPYVYELVEPTRFVLFSMGPDGVAHTSDDIVLGEKPQLAPPAAQPAPAPATPAQQTDPSEAPQSDPDSESDSDTEQPEQPGDSEPAPAQPPV